MNTVLGKHIDDPKLAPFIRISTDLISRADGKGSVYSAILPLDYKSARVVYDGICWKVWNNFKLYMPDTITTWRVQKAPNNTTKLLNRLQHVTNSVLQSLLKKMHIFTQ